MFMNDIYIKNKCEKLIYINNFYSRNSNIFGYKSVQASSAQT